MDTFDVYRKKVIYQQEKKEGRSESSNENGEGESFRESEVHNGQRALVLGGDGNQSRLEDTQVREIWEKEFEKRNKDNKAQA